MWQPAQIERATAMIKAAGFHPIVSNQPGYNMLERWIENEVIPICEREGIGQVVYSPLAQGILTGKYKPGQPLPEGARAADSRQNMFMNGGNLDQGLLEAVQKLAPIAEKVGLTMGQLALAWCLRHKNVSSVIIGASRPSQVEENVGAAGVTLSAEVIAEIDEALEGKYHK
jgi:aryl-alcohol dehydrogenase-like predicted oxidoreductase